MPEDSPPRRGDLPRRLEQGERLAFLELNRMISSCLARLRAYDFREDWEDLRQEVALAVFANLRARRLRDTEAFAGYVRIVTRNKFADRLKRELRERGRQALAWNDEIARIGAERVDDRARARELWAWVAELPAEQQRIVEEVYGEGRTYQEACEALAMPLGTLKRRLREALGALREKALEAEAAAPRSPARSAAAGGGDPLE